MKVVPRSHIDDEYAKAMEKDPKILLTTSRDPSAPLTRFVKVYIYIKFSFSTLVTRRIDVDIIVWLFLFLVTFYNVLGLVIFCLVIDL